MCEEMGWTDDPPVLCLVWDKRKRAGADDDDDDDAFGDESLAAAAAAPAAAPPPPRPASSDDERPASVAAALPEETPRDERDPERAYFADVEAAGRVFADLLEQPERWREVSKLPAFAPAVDFVRRHAGSASEAAASREPPADFEAGAVMES